MATRSQEPAGPARYYWADGAQIPLTPSAHFLAVRPKASNGPASATAARAAADLVRAVTPMDQPPAVLDVPEYDLAIVAIPEDHEGATEVTEGGRGAALRSAVAGSPDLKKGPPIYESPLAGPMTALVPVPEIVLQFEDDTTADQRKRLLSKHKLTILKDDHPAPGWVLLQLGGKGDPVDVANALQENERVRHAEPNFLVVTPRVDQLMRPDAFPADLGTDPNGGLLLHDASTAEFGPDLIDQEEPTGLATPTADPGFGTQWNLQKIRAPQAWAITEGSPGVSIAVLDEGCDLGHEDIQYKLPGYDAFDADNTPQPTGNDAHGTACAGVAAMRKDNAKGGVGVAPGCRVVPIRIAKGVGGGFWSTTSAKVADGIFRAVQAPRSADVLSNSYRVAPSSVVTAAFQYARTHGRGGKGCCIAAAAGNDNAPPVIYPARLSPSIPGMMAVSATNQWDQRKSKTSLDGEYWWGSSFGPEVDIAAPGVKIYAPDITGGSGYAGGNYVPNFNGTSSATPHVAGLMALILSVDPGLRSWEVEDIIKLTADDLGPAGRDPEFGFGRINCRRALEAASRIWYQITVTPVFLGRAHDCYMRANIRMYNPGINTVRLDSLTLRSFSPNWATELDRWEYRPRPGNVLRPRTGDDVRFRRVLLRANGNRARYAYRWSLTWTYTFWRPTSPGFALNVGTEAPLSEAESQQVTANPVRGGGDARAAETAEPVYANGQTGAWNGHAPGQAPTGDLLSIDRESRSITLVIR